MQPITDIKVKSMTETQLQKILESKSTTMETLKQELIEKFRTGTYDEKNMLISQIGKNNCNNKNRKFFIATEERKKIAIEKQKQKQKQKQKYKSDDFFI